MIRWLNPLALTGLSLLALPVLIHLLRTHRAERVPFPSLRFVHVSRTAAVRLRLPSDLLLLVVRLAVVSSAVLAAAQPLLVTAGRWRAWNARIVRAIVIEASAVMTVPDAGGRRPADRAREAVTAESQGAARSVTIDAPRLSDGLVKAAAWLDVAPPGRREIVVLSAFPVDSLRASDVATVPAQTGLRLVQVGTQASSRRIPGVALFSAPESPASVQHVTLDGAKTRVTLRDEPASQRGLRVVGAEMSAPDLQPLWRAIAAAGAPAPSPDEPLACAFGSGGVSQDQLSALGPSTPRWMLRTQLRLQADASLRQIADDATAAALPASTVASVIAVDRNGRPLVRLAVHQQELVMEVAAPAESLAAAAAVRALLIARAGGWARPDHEILRIPPATLAAWSRPAPDLGPDAWRFADATDARWCWLAALALLGVEQWLRRSVARTAGEMRDAA